MRMNLNIQNGHVKVRLADSMDISTIAVDRDHLFQVMQGGDSYAINLAGITEFDTAGIQLLLAFRREVASLGRTCEFQQPSPPVLEAATLYGLESLFSSSLTIS